MKFIRLFLLLLVSGCSATSASSPSTPENDPSPGTPQQKQAVEEDLPDPVAAEIIIALTKEGEKPAAKAYAKILASRKTEKVESRIKKTRMDVVRHRIDKLKTMEDFILFQASFAINAGLPGDDEVSKLVRDEAAEIGKGYSPPEDVTNAERVLAVIHKFGGTDADLAATGLEDKYGPGLANGTIGSDGAWQGFLVLFPHSKYISVRAAVDGARAKLDQEKAQANQVKQEAEQKAAGLDGDFQDMVETVRDIAIKRQQANFAIQHSDMMRRPEQGRAAARMVLTEASRILKEDFCPAKRDYLKKYGPKEFQSRVRRQCDEDPPVGQAELGREVRLDGECRVIFSSGC